MSFFGDFHTNYEKKIVHFLILMKSELTFLILVLMYSFSYIIFIAKNIVYFLILMKSELNFLREQSQFFIFSVLEGLVSYKPVNPPIFSKKDPP